MFNESMKDKLDFLVSRGVAPYPPRVNMELSLSTDLKADFENLSENKTVVAVGGRVMAIRGHGKARFIVLRDGVGEIQIYVRVDAVGEEEYELIKKGLDIGDIVVGIRNTF
ncbi:MAG: OB-fold nucleic acid binding domain-containing protein [Caldisericia bacterium]